LSSEDASASSRPGAPPDDGEAPPAAASAAPQGRPPLSDADVRWVRRHAREQERDRGLEATSPLQVGVLRLLVGNPVVPGILSLLLVPGFPRAHVAVQILMVTMALGISLLLVSAVLTKRARVKWLDVVGDSFYAHGVLTLSVWFWATLSFAGLSALLVLRGIATTVPEHAIKNPLWDSALHFYVWKSLDSVPILEIPETLGWEPAFRFTDHVSPVLLLLYKIVVIVPVIETVRLVWQKRHPARA
jgi:hypothetical protein